MVFCLVKQQTFIIIASFFQVHSHDRQTDRHSSILFAELDVKGVELSSTREKERQLTLKRTQKKRSSEDIVITVNFVPNDDDDDVIKRSLNLSTLTHV